jgi:uracil-DNA glycosylase
VDGAGARPPDEGARAGAVGDAGADREYLATHVPASTDDISERYLKRAIAEINELANEIAQAAGPERPIVLGSGHPQADILLLKYGPQAAELHEGVAFFGRAGQAVLKSIQRLGVDPMAIYGTNCLKYEGEDEEEAHGFLTRELYIVQPKLVVVMGQDALQCLNATRFPLATEVEETPGTLQRFTPTIEAMVTPDLDASLDEQGAKKAFWEAFKAIGPWFSELPPY